MKTLQRVNNSVLGAWERPALAWMAARLPATVVPDHLTALGVLGALLTTAGYAMSRWSLSWLLLTCVGLFINWLGDSLDGSLARLRRIERPRYGLFIDHTSDLFCQTLIFISLGVSPLAHFAVACLGLIAFLIAFVYTLITAHACGTMRITYLYFGPTEIRALLFAGNILILAVGVVDLRHWLPFLADLGAVPIHDAFIVLLSVTGVTVIGLLAACDARTLAVEDAPKPHRTPLST